MNERTPLMRQRKPESGMCSRSLTEAVLRRSGWRILIPGLVAALLMGGVPADAEEVFTVSRDPVTGIIFGAEPRDLGPPDSPRAVLFVHGFIGSGQNFSELPERVAELGWRVRVLLLPGHGTCAQDFKGVTAEALIEAVRTEAQALRERHQCLVLVGHSMGGALSTLVTPEIHPDGLVLAGGYFGVTHKWYYGLTPETWIRMTAPVLPWVYKGPFFIRVNRPEARDMIQSYTWVPMTGSVALAAIGRQASDPDLLDGVTCPVLAIHSHNDCAADPEAMERALGAMTSEEKRVVWVDRSDHHLFFDFDREQVFTETECFLKELESGRDLP